MKKRNRAILRIRFFLPVICIVFLFPANSFGAEMEQKVVQSIKEDAAEQDWNLTLVNEKNPLPEDFQVKTAKLSGGQLFDIRAKDALEKMIQAGNTEGLHLIVASAYRTVERQVYLFDRQIRREQLKGFSYEAAYNRAKMVVAPPGASEHNLGLAADIFAREYQSLDEGFSNTPEGKWLEEHAPEFGFVLRYPEEKSEITGIIFEPWHFRYVGIEHAEKMKELDLCLEEYLLWLQEQENQKALQTEKSIIQAVYEHKTAEAR